MKKLFGILVLVAVVFVSTAAWADYSVFDKKEWTEIIQFAQESWPEARVFVSEENESGHTRIKISIIGLGRSILIEVFPVKGNAYVDNISHKDMAIIAEKIRGRIENILNCPAREALKK